MYVDGGVNRNNGLRNRIDENNRFRERKIPLFDGDAKRFLSFFIFPLIVKRVHRTVLVSPFELQALISILWPRPRCATTKEVGCSCGEGFKLFSIDWKSFSSRINDAAKIRNRGSIVGINTLAKNIPIFFSRFYSKIFWSLLIRSSTNSIWIKCFGRKCVQKRIKLRK